jgi:hypothetical protein
MTNLNVQNSQLSNCGTNCLKLVGGSNVIQQTTIANYYLNLSVSYSRNDASVLLKNYESTSSGDKEYYPLEKAEFANTIIYGLYINEVRFDDVKEENTSFNYLFSDCLLKLTQQDISSFSNVIWNQPVDFVSVKFPYDYRLQSTSPAKNVANISVAANFPYDLKGVLRMGDGLPDLGAYEYVPE